MDEGSSSSFSIGGKKESGGGQATGAKYELPYVKRALPVCL